MNKVRESDFNNILGDCGNQEEGAERNGESGNESSRVLLPISCNLRNFLPSSSFAEKCLEWVWLLKLCYTSADQRYLREISEKALYVFFFQLENTWRLDTNTSVS